MGAGKLVSIIIPVYNGEKYIGQAVESCLQQTAQNVWELVVVNDGSTDSTIQVVEKYLDDPRIKLINQRNKGVASARNSGILESSGNYIAFLDADDRYLSHTIGSFLASFGRAQESVALFYSNYILINEHGARLFGKRVPPLTKKRPDLHLQMLMRRKKDLQPSTIVTRRDALEKVGLFNERYLSCEDIELFTRIVEKYDVEMLDFFGVCRRVHREQMTKDTNTMIHWREEFSQEYLKRHDFCYFCSTHDREKQAGLAEYFGDAMLKATPPWGPCVRTAEYLYERSLSMRFSPRVLTKLRSLKADETSGDQSGEE